MAFEIGTTLRDTRVRRKIEIIAVEEATKIRAKFLRAIEDEEWEVLPDDAYVRSFLRTYAEYLGLDAQLLVDEYGYRLLSEKGEGGQQRTEALSGGRARAADRRQMAGEPGRSRRAWVIAGLVLALLVLLLVLGLTAESTTS